MATTREVIETVCRDEDHARRVAAPEIRKLTAMGAKNARMVATEPVERFIPGADYPGVVRDGMLWGRRSEPDMTLRGVYPVIEYDDDGEG